MVEIPDPVKRDIARYLSRVASEVRIDKAVLFGSYATGETDAQSDVDLAIFSRDFAGLSRLRVLQRLHKHLWGIDRDLEPVGYSLEEYENAHPLDFVGGAIRREGILVCDEGRILI